jgi:hypothetical protein
VRPRRAGPGADHRHADAASADAHGAPAHQDADTDPVVRVAQLDLRHGDPDPVGDTRRQQRGTRENRRHQRRLRRGLMRISIVSGDRQVFVRIKGSGRKKLAEAEAEATARRLLDATPEPPAKAPIGFRGDSDTELVEEA